LNTKATQSLIYSLTEKVGNSRRGKNEGLGTASSKARQIKESLRPFGEVAKSGWVRTPLINLGVTKGADLGARQYTRGLSAAQFGRQRRNARENKTKKKRGRLF